MTALAESHDEWEERAACVKAREIHGDLWFADPRSGPGLDSQIHARRICIQDCTLRESCLERTLAFDPDDTRYGIWAGLDGDQLASLRQGAVSIEEMLARTSAPRLTIVGPDRRVRDRRNHRDWESETCTRCAQEMVPPYAAPENTHVLRRAEKGLCEPCSIVSTQAYYCGPCAGCGAPLVSLGETGPLPGPNFKKITRDQFCKECFRREWTRQQGPRLRLPASQH